ncbi:Erbin [Armadillidium vulgare]|nr:Erbin [Armadillidium vulgare]
MSWMLSCIGCGGKKFVEKEETKVLDFQHYSLTSVPPYVFECERFLEELYLDFNQISELPKELFLCNELLTLSLSDNDLHNIPSAVSSLNNLICLDISKNGISDIPDNIKSCKKLRSVNASTNPLCRLPEGFTQLVALKELSLSDTFLEYLPANFGRLTGLEVLELRENQLNTLPRSFTRLTALKRLDLGQNEFTELPEVVGHLTSLTDLWIDNNRVKRIPPEIGKLTRLSFLDASKNRINEIDSDIGNCKSLSHLYLTRNELEELPDSLSCCLKLSILHVDDNHLDHLPEHIGRLDHLVELKLCQNELSYLPSSVGLLRSLQFLHVDDNMLYTLPGELGSCTSLIVITATHNQITEMPAEMGSLTSLRVLSLCGNSIQSLPVSFSKLQLTALWLSENQAKPSVPLQCTSVAGQKVLTCFMLPQSETQIPSIPEDDKPLTEEEIEARRARRMIHFASDGDAKPSGRLTRVPTPYPKELRALAKHTKNILALKKEKEKSGSSINKEEAVMKDAEKIVPLKESPNSSVAVKTSSAVIKPAAKKMSESAIEKSSPSNEIGSLPEASVAIASTNSPSLPTPTKSSSSPPLCQNGILTSSSTLVAASRATDKSSEDLKHSKESTTEPEFSSVHSTSALSSVHTSPSHHINPGSTLNHHFSETPAEEIISHVSNSQNFLKLTEQPQRPASIALVESFISKGHDVKNYPSRPGSLALESAIPPWQNNRPGSLAAPINTVGIPMAASPQKSSSQNMLNQDNIKSPSFGESLKPLHSPVTPVKKDNFSEIVKENVEELLGKDQLVEIVIPEKMVEDSSSLTTVELASRPIEKETSTDAYKHDKKDTEELSSNTGLLSTISRVTEEGSDEDRSCSHSEISDNKIEKVTSKIPKLPMSVVKTQYSSEENTENYQVSTDTQNFQSISIVSPSAASSKIPHFSYSSKNVQIISPKAPAKDSVISPMGSKILPPMSFTTSYSKISPDKVKSHIPTLSSPSVKKDTNFENKHLEENQQTTRISRSNIEQTSKSVQQEVIPTGKDLTSPKGSSRIPMFSSPAYHSEIKSPSSIPSYPRSPPQTETDSFIPVKESDFSKKTAMSPVEKPINQTGIPILSPDDSSLERTSRIPTVSNSSLRGKKSGLPVLRTSSGKKVVDSSS